MVYIRYHFSCGLDRKDACWLSFTPLTGLKDEDVEDECLSMEASQTQLSHGSLFIISMRVAVLATPMRVAVLATPSEPLC